VPVATVTVLALLPLVPLSGHAGVVGELISLALTAGLLGDVLTAHTGAFCALSALLIGTVGLERWPSPTRETEPPLASLQRQRSEFRQYGTSDGSARDPFSC